jgi:2-iminoacetate synthase
MKSFIQEKRVWNLLHDADNPPLKRVKKIIDKSKRLQGLTPEEVATLLQCQDEKMIQYLFKTAKRVKEMIYGKRLVLFAPLYVSNFCINDCAYCGFRRSNTKMLRKKLTLDEVREEVKILEKMGHKRLLLEFGEDPVKNPIDYVTEVIKTVYSTKNGGEIRRVNVNIAAAEVEDYIKLKEARIGTYQLFQETYHRKTYEKMHRSGPKSDYKYRLFAMDRAQEGGIDDLGIGALFGLYDYRFEVIALLLHSIHLDEKFGVGPHTISVPRIEPALGAPVANNPPNPVSDHDFKKLVAILRLAVPYTGIILSTREKPPFRDEVFNLGVSQISAGSRTSPGGYSQDLPHSSQFSLGDTRTLAEVVLDISKAGFYPSFCTACYRLGRTGKDFMDLAKPGHIKKFCLPNSILTYKEYLLDYGNPELRKVGERVILEQLKEIKNKKLRQKTIKKLHEFELGKRDIYF